MTAGQLVENILAGAGIDEICRADLYSGGPGQHHLHDVPRRGDAAHADDGDGHGLIDLVDHPHRHREDGWTGEAAHFIGDDRLAPGTDQCACPAAC